MAKLGKEFAARGVAVDGNGTVYTSGWDGDQFVIAAIPEKGKPTRRAIPCSNSEGLHEFDGANLLAAPDGTLFWSMYFQYRVVRLDPGGGGDCFAGTGKEGSAGDGGPAIDAELGGVKGVAFDSERGDLYILEQTVPSAGDEKVFSMRRVDADGAITAVSGFIGPRSGTGKLTFDQRRGRLYALVRGGIAYRDPDGSVEDIPGDPGFPFLGLAADLTGANLVAIRGMVGACEVVRVAESGQTEPMPGGRLQPDCTSHVAVDSRGDVWVITSDSRLLVIRPSG